MFADLRWMNTRWRVLDHITCLELDPNDIAAASLFPMVPSRPSRLISVQMHHRLRPKEGCWVDDMDDFSDDDSMARNTDSDSDASLVDVDVFSGFVQRVVQQSPHLKYLSLSLRVPVDLPLLNNLQVLDVELVETEAFAMVGHLPQFQALEVLCLGYRKAEFDESLLDIPPLVLSDMQNLSQVVLRDVSPSFLFLRPGCRLGLVWTNREYDGPDGTAPTVRPDVLVWIPGWYPFAVSQFPPWSSTADLMTLVLIKVLGDSLTILDVPLGFSKITRCHLSGQDVYIHIPVEVRWEEVDIAADDALSLSFEDMPDFVSCVRVLRLAYGHMAYEDQLQLYLDLRSLGKDCALVDVEVGKGRLVVPAVLAQASLTQPVWGACTCGCCYACRTTRRYSLG